jgi:Ca2+-transporting ATPase
MISARDVIAGGLTSEEAARRLRETGANAVPQAKPPSIARRVLRQLASPLIYVLLFAVVFDVVTTLRDGHGWPIEGTVIAAVLALNAALGAAQEQRADSALAELKRMASPVVWAVRDGALARVAASALVPGDRVRVEAGERLPADGAVAQQTGLLVDESMLTGESIAIDKRTGDEAFAGTLVVRGKGFVDVTRTGSASAMGRLAAALAGVATDRTPLERRLDALGGKLARWVGGLALVLAAAGIAAEGTERLEEIVFFAVALAVAAVPEGMPAVVTLTLSLGVQRMARRHAVVRRLASVETLGSVTVIATDKTGTLTENRMHVETLDVDDAALDEALRAIVLANDADPDSGAGDPLEVGLYEHARARGVDPVAVRRAHPVIASRPFDAAWKFMRVTIERGAHRRSYLKGAPEVLIARAHLDDAARVAWAARADAAAAEGQRVLAIAAGDGEGEYELELLGLVTLWDPPRPEVPGAIQAAQGAGVRVLMITGDHPATASAIARRIGLARTTAVTGAALEGKTPEALRALVQELDVFARVTPEHKLAIVEALQANGEIVAVTGDGVNDAPALKRADVGVAMGTRGSDVAREVADLVLIDDDFATIVGAIEEGRNIYEDIQSFLRFSFSTNVALVLLLAAGVIGSYVLGLRDETGMLLLPLTALQILWINFLGDGPPGLALALDRNDGVMARPPRPTDAGLLDAPSVRFVFASGLFKASLGIAALVALPLAGFGLLAIQSVIFQTEALGKLFSTFAARRVGGHARRNPGLYVAVIAGLTLQVLTLTVPALRGALRLEAFDLRAAGVMVLVIVLAAAGENTLAWLVRRPSLRLRHA